MAVVGLDHVQVAIPKGGEERAREFYRELLSMDEVAKPDHLSATGCWFASGAVSIHVGVDPDFVPARKAHPALLVDDLATVRSCLDHAGYETLDDKPIDGYDRFFTFDPFGNRVELMQRVGKAG